MIVGVRVVRVTMRMATGATPGKVNNKTEKTPGAADCIGSIAHTHQRSYFPLLCLCVSGDWGDAVVGDVDVLMSTDSVSSPVLTRQSSFLVLDNQAITERLQQLIKQTAEVLFVTTDEAGSLLRHYGWKSKKLQVRLFMFAGEPS